jgi:hypothetical protein
MNDQTNPTRPARLLGFGTDTIYTCVLVGIAAVLLVVGFILSPVIRVIALIFLLAYIGFFLAFVITTFLGYAEVPSEIPRARAWTFTIGVTAGLIIFTVVFGVGWLAGFLVYMASVVGILVLMEKRRREDPDVDM